MNIKNFKQFVNESTVNELSGATIDAAQLKRSKQVMDRGQAGENVEKEYNKMSALYKNAKTREVYQSNSAIGKITNPCVVAAQVYAAKLDALVKDGDVYGTVIYGDVRRGPITKKILVMYNINEVVLGEVNSRSASNNESGSRNIIVRLDESSVIYVPNELVAELRKTIQPILDLASWKKEVETKLYKFAHTEGSQTITPELVSELPKMEGYSGNVKAEDRIKPMSEFKS